MVNLIVALILIAIVSIAVRKILVEKKKGAKCIGCPYGGSNDSNCNCK